MPTPTTLEIEFGGRTLILETGRLAGNAGGAVTARYGDSMVLGTANRSEPRPGLDFFPLTVDFEERMYAAGKIPGGFIKREGRASEAATLAARLTDRPIRPLFPEGYKDDVQIVITTLSTDHENELDVLGTIAASAALTISEIPFQGPIGAVHVGYIDGEFVLNPTTSQLVESQLDLVVAGTRDAIMMVEAGVKILPEDVMAEAIMFAHRSIAPLIDLQEELREKVGKAKRLPYLEPATDSVLTFAELAKAGGEFVVVDVETTGTDPKMADLVEVAAVRVKGGKITDRWSTYVNPGRPIVGNQMHGITDKDVKGAPTPAEAARKALDFVGDALFVGHSVGFDIAFLEAALGDGTRIEQGRYLDTLVIAREGYPELENYKLPTLAELLRGRAQGEPPRPPGRRGDRDPAELVRQRPARPDRRPQGRHRDRGPRHAHRQGRVREAARGGPPPGALQQEPVRARAEEDRPRARPRRGPPHGRPRHRRDPPDLGRGRPAPACARLRPVHPRPDPGPDRRHARRVLGRPADRHDQRGDREAVPPPLQLPALQHR